MATSTGAFTNRRCPRVTRPAFSGPTTSGSTSASSSARMERTGRAKRNSSPRHFMVLGKLSAVMSPGQPLQQHGLERAPGSCTVATRYSPPGVSTRRSASTGTPCFFANPSPFLVSAPSGPNATFAGGPITSLSRSAWRSPMPWTSAISRRGAANVLHPRERDAPLRKPRFQRGLQLRRGGRQVAGRDLLGADFQREGAAYAPTPWRPTRPPLCRSGWPISSRCCT